MFLSSLKSSVITTQTANGLSLDETMPGVEIIFFGGIPQGYQHFKNWYPTIKSGIPHWDGVYPSHTFMKAEIPYDKLKFQLCFRFVFTPITM